MPKYKITYGSGQEFHDEGETQVIEADSLTAAEDIAWETCHEVHEDHRWAEAELVSDDGDRSD